MLTSANRLAIHDLIHRYKHGLEATIRMVTALYDIDVVFEGTKARSIGRTIILPNVDIFALKSDVTNEAVEEARAYFMALKGFAWQETAAIVETDHDALYRLCGEHGLFVGAMVGALNDIRVEHRFAKRGEGIAEAIAFTREQWVWPRFVRRKVNAPNMMAEVVYGLQVMLLHNDQRHSHQLWQALYPEVRSFVERFSDDLDAAYDTLKMPAKAGTERLGEVVVRMLQRWRAEWESVKELVPKQRYKAKRVDNSDESDGLDAKEDDLRELVTSEGVSPFLFVTYGSRVSHLSGVPFADGYTSRVEPAPVTPEEWQELYPLQGGELRTLVVLPPDPEEEKALVRALAALIGALRSAGSEIAAAAEEKLEEAQIALEKLPADQLPYIVYSTADDQFVTTPNGSQKDLHRLQSNVAHNVGVVKRRLQILLRSKTRSRWRGNRVSGTDFDQNAIADIALSHVMKDMELRPYRVKVAQDSLCGTVAGVFVDVSGSMCRGYPVPKLEVARETALCFAEAMSHAKLSFAVWAFTSDESTWQSKYDSVPEDRRDMYGRFGALKIETVKDFNERWMTVATRLPLMGRDNQANYDADSVQWAVRKMLAQKAERRVLFVLSDGQPDTSEPRIQVARQRRHLADVVKAGIRSGVEIVGGGICDSSVKLYYPRSFVVNRASELPKVVMSEMEYLLLRSRR